jgi:hypothetical protein
VNMHKRGTRRTPTKEHFIKSQIKKSNFVNLGLGLANLNFAKYYRKQSRFGLLCNPCLL